MNAMTGERLLITLEARLAKYERDITRARRKTDTQLGGIEARVLRTSRNLKSSFAAMKSLGGPLAVAFSAAGAKQLVDAATRIENALKVAGLEGERLREVYDELFASAQRNATPLETLTTLYGRLALVQNELGVSQEELLTFTDRVALALRVAGTDAGAASGALLQLSQAMGSGIVRAEEFNSILEGALPIAQAAAAGLEEAGGSVAKLRQLVVDGKVSSEAFFRAFEAGAAILEQKVAGAEMTLTQRFVRLQNVLIDTAGRINEATGATDALGKVFDAVAEIIPQLGDALVAAAGPVGTFLTKVDELEAGLWRLAKRLGELTGLNEIGVRIRSNLDKIAPEDVQRRIDGAFDDPARTTDKADRLPPAPPAIETVSLSDYALPPSGGRGGRGTKGDDYTRALEQARKRIELLRLETAALAGVNPLVDDYGRATGAAAMKAELLAAAQSAGREVTPEVAAQIDQLASSYGAAAADAEELAERQDKARETAEALKGAAREALGGFISDLREGKSLTEALANALNNLADRLLNLALNFMFSGFGFAKGGEVKGFAGGGHVRGPGTGTSDSIQARLSDGEHVINARSARKHRALLEAINADRLPGFSAGGAVGGVATSAIRRMSGGSSGAPNVNVSAPITINGSAGTPEQNADLAKKLQRSMEETMRGVVADEMRQQTRPGNTFNRRSY